MQTLGYYFECFISITNTITHNVVESLRLSLDDLL